MGSPIETIEQAAIRVGTTVYSVPRPGRHGDVFAFMRTQGCDDVGFDQGFKTSQRNFVDREEAMRIARRAGQILKDPTFQPDTLFSEDVW